MKLLPDHELLEVLKASTKDRANLLIGISVDFDHKYVILYRCDATPLEVPFTWFTEDGDSPDFSRAEIIDYGQTVKLGDFEVRSAKVIFEASSQPRKKDAREYWAACPCVFLDAAEVCNPQCTCRNGLYSYGCDFCATYGSDSQKKSKAKRIADKLRKEI